MQPPDREKPAAGEAAGFPAQISSGPDIVHQNEPTSEDCQEKRFQSNRLPVLAASIRAAHEGVVDAATTAAERAIEAGQALVEAKALVKHGQWLPWLRVHCTLTERTAQLYMAIARSGLKSETVADLGLKAAARVDFTLYDEHYNPYHHCDETGKRDWALFVLFLVKRWKWNIDGASQHVEYLLQKQFRTPGEWFGDEGHNWRHLQCLREPSAEYVTSWSAFLAEGVDRTFADIEAELTEACP